MAAVVGAKIDVVSATAISARASLPSGSSLPTFQTTRSRTRLEIGNIHSGLDEKNCLSGSAPAIRTGIVECMCFGRRPNRQTRLRNQLGGDVRVVKGVIYHRVSGEKAYADVSIVDLVAGDGV